MKKLHSSTVGTCIGYINQLHRYAWNLHVASNKPTSLCFVLPLLTILRNTSGFITNKRISVPMQLKKQALLTKQGLFLTIFTSKH
ncbi:MAG: hypothetical protein IPJ79_20305 [Bacteroidetes bacterium]|nr:hypothetical protein [Bacteroidota bacterium]